jgi:NTE family protein
MEQQVVAGRSSVRFSFSSLLVLLSCIAFAQDNVKEPSRPGIGLVLEGGGAYGLAHIGVLQWIEEHHIPVDYVAGTSMGGLIGGAYASGMHAGEVRTLVTQIDWDAVLRGEREFSDLSFRRKEDRRAYPNALEFGLKNGVKFPAGFNSGQEVDFILDRIALPYSGVTNFDDLPIPFRCIATELTTSSKHVFNSGSLSQALRATMSIPGFFTPVKSDGRIFVDGGLLDNLPTDVAKEMGADVTLAVHLDISPLSPGASLSSFAVLAQAFSVVTAVNEKRGMELADILVRVDLTKFRGTDYTKSNKLIAAGYEAAQKSASALLKYSLDDAAWQEYLNRRDARRIKSVPVPGFVEVKGTSPELAEAMEKGLSKNAGRPVDEARLERQLMTISSTGRFASMGYSVTEVDDRFGLRVRAVEKEYAPPIINPLVVVDGSQYNNVRFGAGARLTFLDVGKPGVEWRTDVLAGSTYRLASEYVRPFHRSIHWFLAPRVELENSPIDLYSHNTQLAEYRRSDINAGFDIGYTFDRFSELRVGYQTGWLKYHPDIGNTNVLPTVSGRQGISRIRYITDKLDDPVVPRKGTSFVSDFSVYDARPGSAQTFPALAGSFQYFKPIRRVESLYFRATGGTTFTYPSTGVPLFTLGGPGHLSAYGTNEIFTNQYMLFEAGYLRQIGQLPPIVGDKIYLLGLSEFAKPYGTPQQSTVPMDVAGGVIVETLVGPVLVGGSWGDSGHRKFFFMLGRIF